MTETKIPTTTVELRKFAQQLGLKGLSSANKATLVPAVTAEVERREAEKAAKKAAKAPAKAKAPKVERRRYSADELAGYENHHSDNGHDAINAGKVSVKDWTFKSQKALDEFIESERVIMADCPVCHPEKVITVNLSEQRYAESRQGMVMHVKRGMTAEEKAQVVVEALKVAGVPSRVSNHKGEVTVSTRLRGDDVKLVFTRKTLDSTVSRIGSKRIHNVAAALRIIAAS